MTGRATVQVICDDCGAVILTEVERDAQTAFPHVFRRETCDPAAFSAASWDKIKREESGGETLAASLNRVSPALPSLRYAEKIIGKLAQLPGNQRSAEEIRVLLSFALQDLLKADASDAEPKLGNLLFLCAELAGLLGLDAEVALHRAVRKAVSACQSPESAGN